MDLSRYERCAPGSIYGVLLRRRRRKAARFRHPFADLRTYSKKMQRETILSAGAAMRTAGTTNCQRVVVAIPVEGIADLSAEVLISTPSTESKNCFLNSWAATRRARHVTYGATNHCSMEHCPPRKCVLRGARKKVFISQLLRTTPFAAVVLALGGTGKRTRKTATRSAVAENIAARSMLTASTEQVRYANIIYRTVEADLYLGCYIDHATRDLPWYYPIKHGDNTPINCCARCRVKGFRYCALQINDQCHCGNSYGRYGKGDCTHPCEGSPDLKCGGTWRNSVYAVGYQPASVLTKAR
ncbi:predicted protein [Nematostella vectensis]|uniref:WSC domain-containing protein n=1 Tax=Nematostella vectensis TaxID=45351 RepID=A7S7V8_NEMVE|nr:predicted protein [Nematostella vectensis]|eukprot:XP_001632207.1 predicted protein [Nematostella vectensis]